MPDSQSTTALIQNRLDALRAGDEQAKNALVQHAYDRLRKLARGKLAQFPRVKAQGEPTESVLNEVVLRLQKALQKAKPETPGQFFALAAKHIRWTLLDFTESPHLAGLAEDGDSRSPGIVKADSTAGPATRAGRHERDRNLLRAIDDLPESLREVVDLLYTQGLTQEEAAEVLGVSKRTVGRRSRDARLALADALGEKSQ
jgi:RNA polymerase sigma-70 factor (ECF subfamily)